MMIPNQDFQATLREAAARIREAAVEETHRKTLEEQRNRDRKERARKRRIQTGRASLEDFVAVKPDAIAEWSTDVARCATCRGLGFVPGSARSLKLIECPACKNPNGHPNPRGY